MEEVITILTATTDKVDITVTTTHTAVTEADIYRMTKAEPATFITEHHQAGIHQKHIAIPSEHGNKTCKFGYT